MKFVALMLPCVMLAVMSASAQSGQGAGTVEGTVIDNISRSPVRKAQVVLLPRAASSSQGPRTAVSDSGGSFRFIGLFPGPYAISVKHPRYPVRPGASELRQVEVKPGETLRADVALDPGSAISGRIADEDGDPVQGCQVRLQYVHGQAVNMPPMGTQSTNEQGEYRLWGINAGTYVAAVQCPRPVFQPRPFSAGPQAPPSMAYPVQYYPAASEATAAQPIELAYGAERTGVDFRLKPARVFTISGSVTAPAGRSLENILIHAVKKGDPYQRRVSTLNPALGTFEIMGIFPGSYELIAGLRNQNLTQGAIGGRQSVEVIDRPVQLQLALHAAVDIAGSVEVESDNPFPANQIQLEMIAERGLGIVSPPPVKVSDDGSFVCKGVLPGRWRLTLHGPNVFLKSVELNGRTGEGKTIDVPPSAVGPLRIIASTRTGTIEGSGVAGRNYIIVESVGDSSFGRQHMITPGTGGRIQLTGLAPGLYRIYEGDPSGMTPPLKEVTIPEGGTATVDLRRGSSPRPF